MKFKICSKCKKEKPISKFSKNKNTFDGLCCWCKECMYISKKEYIKNNILKAEQQKKFSNKRYQEQNKEKIRLNKKQYYEDNKEHFKQKSKEYRKVNIDYHKEYNKEYCKNNKEKRNKLLRKKYSTNLNYKMLCNLRTRLNKALKNNWKSGKTLELLGCTIKELKQHLDFQFTKGMNLDNYGFGKGRWNIDHIKPCAKFDLSKKSEQRECFNYTNLQPLWAIDNIKKSNHY